MCGRYFLDEDGEQSARLLNLLRALLESGHPLAAQVHAGEIFPTQLAPVILSDGGRAVVRPMRWGFPRGGGRGVVINSLDPADPLYREDLVKSLYAVGSVF